MPQCRCLKCGARKTLAMKPESYLRPPRCPYGHKKGWRIDKYRMRKEVGRGAPPPCYCGEYAGRTGSMPHRRGGGWCIHNERISLAMREERWEFGSRMRCQ